MVSLLFDTNEKDDAGKNILVKKTKLAIVAKDVAELAIFLQQERQIKEPLMKIGLDSG